MMRITVLMVPEVRYRGSTGSVTSTMFSGLLVGLKECRRLEICCNAYKIEESSTSATTTPSTPNSS
eukprot:6862999-Karenia_brevis.AAC.1